MLRIVWLILSAILFTSVTQAKPLTPEQVPDPLKPWIAWALQDSPDPDCPFIYNNFQQKRCNWPTQIQLELTTDKGVFSINERAYRDGWISLPGDEKHWPLNVTANNKPALVMNKDGIPSVKLAANILYQIDGEFRWNSIPDNLRLPEDIGLIALRINGAGIPTPAIKDGQLWLKESETGLKKPENIQNNLDIQVFRKITDEVPAEVLTRLVLDVSGEQREVKLPQAALDGFIPLSLQSPLPARLEADGQLLVQLRPGHWQIDLVARNSMALNELVLPKRDLVPNLQLGNEEEIWSFDARPQLRVVEIERLSAIDPSLTNLPDEWKILPAYKINPGQSMGFKTIRRGDPEPEPNQLNLSKKLWLDFDGSGYTVNDTITGKLTRGWRLNTLPQTQLGKVMLNGNNQLITQDTSGKQGVEVRSGTLSLDADSRTAGAVSSISATGWEQDFHTVSAELNLPPGWRLLATSGVDNVPDSWISRWTLLDLFLVLIAALATSRLWNSYWGGLALVTLTLIWHEPGSPHYVWLNILAATALIKVLPQGRFLKAISMYRNAFWLVLILTALPFMVEQVRTGLYPQLEQPDLPIIQASRSISMMGEINTPLPEALSEMKSQMLKRSMPQDAPASYGYTDQAAEFGRIDPKAKVQTGPGLPQWQWHKVQLSWNGSVDAGQQLRLWYLTPTLTLLLNFVRVILVALLALLMFGVAEKISFKNLRSSTPLLLCFLLLPLLSLPSPNVYADIPDKALLDELRTRLLEKPVQPDCLPSCAQIQQMKLVITDQELTVTLQIHAQQAVAIPLPAEYQQWFPNQILVDGKAALGLYRDNNGLWINLGIGEHQLVMSGITPLLSKFTLPLPLKPNWVSIQASGWDILGLQANGQVDDQLQFSRINQTKQQQHDAALEPIALPPFVRLERHLQLGLDWQVVTRIIRVSPADSAIVLAVPLLPGESVTSAGIRVKEGKVEVNIPAQQSQMQWESTLEKSEQINYVAAESSQWIEVLTADISPIWHVETSGIAMIHLNTEGLWLPEWHPHPGEKITLQITRPVAVAGQTLTIDNSRLSIKPGQRNRDVQLNISLRSSQGQQHSIILPEKAELQNVAINGQSLPIRQEGRKLTLPVNPGKQEVLLNWREASGISNSMATPEVDLGLASVNASLNIELGQDRWVLFAFGPKLGPAVLFWGVLIVLFIVSLGLGKIRLTPLKASQWFLLLVGLSQIPLQSAIIVIAWLMLLGWRRTQQLAGMRYFNALQVLIAGLTLVALGLLFFAVKQGLLGSPDMQVIGNQSSAFNLDWYQDRSLATLPVATLISVPLIVYRILMLAWSLWLAVSLLNWLKWGWECFASNGFWHKTIAKKQALAVEPDDKWLADEPEVK